MQTIFQAERPRPLIKPGRREYWREMFISQMRVDFHAGSCLMFVQCRQMIMAGRWNSVFRPLAESVRYQCRIGILRPVRRDENIKVAEKAHVRLGIVARHQTGAALEQHRFDVDGIERSDNAPKRLEQYRVTPPVERQDRIQIIVNLAWNTRFVMQASRQRRCHAMKAA